MANYTITRSTETSHTYGCTQFSTNQIEGQIATDGGPLDSTIVWDIKADQGFYYLATNSQFLKLGGVYVQETQNIRNRKLIHQFTKKEGAL